MNILAYLPEANHVLAVLGALLFINQLRLARGIRRNAVNAHAAQQAVVEVAAQSTVTEQNLEAFAEIAEQSEMRTTTTGADVREALNMIQAINQRLELIDPENARENLDAVRNAFREALSELQRLQEAHGSQTLGAVRQVVESMIVGHGSQWERRMQRLEKLMDPLPPLEDGNDDLRRLTERRANRGANAPR